MAIITYNPLYAVFSEDYSDASNDQREKIIKSKCREGESIILTLKEIFPGDIQRMEIPELNLSVPCILNTYKELNTDDQTYILSASEYLKIT